MEGEVNVPDSPERPSRRAPPLGVSTAVALLAGITTCALLPALPPWPLLAAFGAGGAWGWWRAGHAWRMSRRIAGAALFGLALFGLHAAWALSTQLPVAMERADVPVRGQVVELPVDEPRRTSFRFRVDDDRSQHPALRGRQLQLSWYDTYGKPQPSRRDEIRPGARWSMTVRVRAPRGLRNPGVLDSERSALAQRITATGYVRDPLQARELAPPRGVDAGRDAMSKRIARDVVAPSSRFVRALALGDTRGLTDEDWDTLRAAGLTHLIAISGFHVGMVASLCALLMIGLWRLWPALARRVPRPQAAAVAALFGAFGYAAVAGFALPTVRTVLMIAIVVLARLLRRQSRVLDALALAALAVLLVDPLSVLTAGFWLSFAGVAWLTWCLPDAGTHVLRDFLSAQGVATLSLLPLTVVLFGQASLAGPLANFVAIPWWSFVVVPLALTGTGLEALHAGLGAWAWKAAAWCFDLAWPLFDWLASSDVALWWLPEARWFALPLAVIGGAWLLLPRGVPAKPLATLLWLPLLWPDRRLPSPGEAELVVLDVGQGLSVLVRTARHTLLYDMGAAKPDGFDAGERVGVPSLRALGVRGLDAAIVSHADNDHAGGFPAIQRAYPLPVAFAPADSGVPATRPCLAGTQWSWDGVTFRVLHPPPFFPYLDNDSSCVLRIESAHGVALLTGDIDAVVERELVRRDARSVRADIVLVAHHGSRGSSDPAFIAATHATTALVSAGFGNRYGHPAPAAMERWRDAGAAVFDTMDGGALRVPITRAPVQVEANRLAHPRLWDAAARQARGRADAAPLPR